MQITIDPAFMFWAFTGSVAVIGTLLTTLALLVVNGITRRITSCHDFLLQKIDNNNQRAADKFVEIDRRLEKLEDD